MEDKEMYEAGEIVIFDYADEEPRTIWGLHFELGDAIAVKLHQRLTQEDLLREMGSDGPWAWGGFTTEWIEGVADRIEWLYDNRLLFSSTEQETRPIRDGLPVDAAAPVQPRSSR